MPTTIVVGGQYGSDGKGKLVAYLAHSNRVDLVIRCGGPNAGHSGSCTQRSKGSNADRAVRVICNMGDDELTSCAAKGLNRLLRMAVVFLAPADLKGAAGIPTGACETRTRLIARYF